MKNLVATNMLHLWNYPRSIVRLKPILNLDQETHMHLARTKRKTKRRRTKERRTREEERRGRKRRNNVKNA